MLIKDFFYFYLLRPFRLGDGSHLSNFCSGSPKEHFCEINWKSKNWPIRRCCLKTFSILSSGGHLFRWQNDFCNFGREKHFCENILKSVDWSRKRCHLKVFLFLALVVILFSVAERF